MFDRKRFQNLGRSALVKLRNARVPKITRLHVLIAFLICAIVGGYIGFSYIPTGYRRMSCLMSSRDINRQEDLLTLFTEIAHANNFSWWVDYGVLLGAVRNGHLLPWDKDLDGSFLSTDMPRFQALDDALQHKGLKRTGLTIHFQEDTRQFVEDSELLPARLEFFAVEESEPGVYTRSDWVKASRDHSLFGWFWWKCLTWTMTTTFQQSHVMFPLNTVELEHYPKEDKSRSWRLVVPSPYDPKEYLRVLYGESWHKEIKWKLTCYYGDGKGDEGETKAAVQNP